MTVMIDETGQTTRSCSNHRSWLRLERRGEWPDLRFGVVLRDATPEPQENNSQLSGMWTIKEELMVMAHRRDPATIVC